jgi:hypothetical protein
MQTNDVFAPTALEKVPASHEVQVLAAVMEPNDPASHAMHVCEPVSFEK